MHIRRAVSTDRDVLVDIWLRSVRVTHTFLSEADIQSFLPLVRDYVASVEPEFWVLCSDSQAIMGPVLQNQVVEPCLPAQCLIVVAVALGQRRRSVTVLVTLCFV
jgi:hypothetical protein